MGIDAMKMEEVKDWIRNDVASREKRDNYFEAISLSGRMTLEQENEDTFACIPVSEVQGILRRCAYELGMTYEQ